MTLELPPSVIATWHFSPDTDSYSPVLPDGCRDLILHVAKNGHPQWFVSALADTLYPVYSQAGERFVGYRFHPAAQVCEQSLLALVRSERFAGTDKILSAINATVQINTCLDEALHSLATNSSISRAHLHLGVSERSLERLVKTGTGRSPGYWKSLARARRAALALNGNAPLVEVAGDCGYADQAHMNREFRKWFATTPGVLRESPALLALVAAAGYS